MLGCRPTAGPTCMCWGSQGTGERHKQTSGKASPRGGGADSQRQGRTPCGFWGKITREADGEKHPTEEKSPSAKSSWLTAPLSSSLHPDQEAQGPCAAARLCPPTQWGPAEGCLAWSWEGGPKASWQSGPSHVTIWMESREGLGDGEPG